MGLWFERTKDREGYGEFRRRRRRRRRRFRDICDRKETKKDWDMGRKEEEKLHMNGMEMEGGRSR